MDRRILLDQVPHALARSDLAGFAPPRRGKVRDIYELGGERLLFVTTDRISAFDVILGTVPFKGELLTGLAAAWFERTADACPNHVLDRPDPSALVVRKLHGIPVEVVVRGRLTGSLWRDYTAGRDPYRIALPPGLVEGHVFETPIITPTTKAEVGAHDQPLSAAEVVGRGLVGARRWNEVVSRARDLFAAGVAHAASRGLVLVDTKYEFGTDAGGKLFVMDEIHTPDSSRYWRVLADGTQVPLDKEFLRQWLIAQGWMGNGPPPAIPSLVLVELAERYLELFRELEGTEPLLAAGDVAARLDRNLASLRPA